LSTRIHPLIFIPSARDLREFYDATNKLPYDKLWVKYYPQYEAYVVARWTFLNNPKNYTHLVIVPDDLIVTQDVIERLLEHPDIVISGWCVHGKSPEERKGLDTNLSYSVCPEPPYAATYYDCNFIPIDYIRELYELIEVGFAGFAPTIIPRFVMEQVEFRGSQGCCIDSCFGIDLDKQGIKQYADPSVMTIELEATDPNLLQVGKKERKIVLESI
jgi:hypothetical protein